MSDTELTFQVERFGQYQSDAEPLQLEHWREIASDKDRMPIGIDLHRFSLLDATGQLLICTARRGGWLIGYVAYVVCAHPHYATVTCAFEDAYFLTASERTGNGLSFRKQVGVRLIEFSLERAKDRGAKQVKFHTKEIRSVAAVLKRLGMKKTDEIYTMWLEN